MTRLFRQFLFSRNLLVAISYGDYTVILWGYHPTLKLSIIPTLTLILSLAYSMDNI